MVIVVDIGGVVLVAVAGGVSRVRILAHNGLASSLCDSSLRSESEDSELDSNSAFVGVLHFDRCLIFCRNVGMQVTPGSSVACAFHSLGIMLVRLVVSAMVVNAVDGIWVKGLVAL